jgi:hypothetical protein
MRNTANENAHMFKILGTCITYTLVKQETLSEATQCLEHHMPHLLPHCRAFNLKELISIFFHPYEQLEGLFKVGD